MVFYTIYMFPVARNWGSVGRSIVDDQGHGWCMWRSVNHELISIFIGPVYLNNFSSCQSACACMLVRLQQVLSHLSTNYWDIHKWFLIDAALRVQWMSRIRRTQCFMQMQSDQWHLMWLGHYLLRLVMINGWSCGMPRPGLASRQCLYQTISPTHFWILLLLPCSL